MQPIKGLVAQLNSALDYGSRGYKFESCRGHNTQKTTLKKKCGFFYFMEKIKINELLTSLMDDVQNDLAKIWPMLFVFMKFFNKTDGLIANFSMNLARDGAWKFANELVNEELENRSDMIAS